MYGILAEDRSDVEVLQSLVQRIATAAGDKKALSFKTKGYSGCAEMIRKGARDIRLFAGMSVNRVIVCYDSDRCAPGERVKEVEEEVLQKAGVKVESCIVVPVQEIEAWILADMDAVKHVLTAWKSVPKSHTNPESLNDPKEHLERLSKRHGKPLYVHAIHNSKVAKHLNLDLLRQRCPSFKSLYDFVHAKHAPPEKIKRARQ